MLVFCLNVTFVAVLKFLKIGFHHIYINLSVQVLSTLIPIIIIFIAIKYLYKASILETLGLKITRDNFTKYLNYGILLSFLIFLCSFLISIIMPIITQQPLDNPYAKYSVEELKIISLLSIIFAPIFEEIFFRGFLQPAACQAIGNIKGTIVISVLFALLHHQYANHLTALAIIINLSLILGFARLYFDSVVPGIIGHLLNNLYASISILMGSYV